MLGMCNYVHYACAYNREGFLANLEGVLGYSID